MEQLQNAKAELTKLKSTVGELPPVEVIEGVKSEGTAEQPKLVDRVIKTETDVVEVREVIDTLFGGAE